MISLRLKKLYFRIQFYHDKITKKFHMTRHHIRLKNIFFYFKIN